MGFISRAYQSLITNHKKILTSLLIGVCGTVTSIAIAIPLDKVDYDIVISEDNYPHLFAKKNKYGFSEKLSTSQLNALDGCNSSAGCSSEAVQKGATRYEMSSAGGYGLATAYYNSNGKLVGTHIGGIGSTSDTTDPVITISGANPLTLQKGSSYNYNYATAQDNVDGSLTVSNSGTVNTNVVGTYTVTYSATDAAGNVGSKNHTVNIVNQTSNDTIAPVITISGANPLTLQKGSSYNYNYATAQDNVDGSLTVSNSGTVNTNVVGTYTVTYSATDAAGNVGSQDHTVNIVNQTNDTGNTTPPTIPVAKKLSAVDGNSFIDSTADPVGYLDGEFSVSPSGAATYNVPIAIPPGTAGVQPNISLAYNSQSGVGAAGLGWSISGLSSISRCSKTLAQDFEVGGIEMNSDDVLCLDGQRLIKTYENLNAQETQTRRRYKTEIDNYAEIKQIKRTGGNYYEVTTKAGEIHTYGYTDDSSLYLNYLAGVENSTVRIAFQLNRTQDLKGNYIDYTYDNSSVFKGKIKRIKYTGNVNTGDTPYHFINFSYVAATQAYTGYVAGSTKYRPSRLEKISVDYFSTPIREYKLSYLDVSNDTNKIDKLKSIQECVGTNCLPATEFNWDGHYKSQDEEHLSSFDSTKNLPRQYIPDVQQVMQSDFGAKSFLTNTAANGSIFSWDSNSSSGNYHPNYSQKLLGDVDGDGLTDIVGINFRANRFRCNSGNSIPNGRPCVEVSTSTGKNFHYPKSTLGLASNDSGATPQKYPSFLGDVNGDGLVDLINFASGKIIVYRSNGEKFITGQIWKDTSSYSSSSTWNINSSPVFVQDMNADGRADIVTVGSGGIYVWKSNGSGFDNFQRWTQYFGTSTSSTYRQTYSNDNTSIQFIDVSADGLPDAVIHSSNGTMVALNQNGNSFDVQLNSQNTPVVITPPSTNTPINKYTPRLMGDINADGYPDIVGFFEDAVYVSYGIGKNSSNKLFLPYTFAFSEWTRNSGWDYTKQPLYVIDMNADGRADIVAFDNSGVSVRLAQDIGFENDQPWTSSFGSNAWDSVNDVRTLGDMNGDGLADIVGINETGVSIGINQVKQKRITQITIGGKVPDNNPTAKGMNRSIDIEYENLTAARRFSVYTKSNDSRAMQAPIFVVAAHFSSKSTTGASTDRRKVGMHYQYEGLLVDRAYGRGVLGFQKRKATDLSSNIYSLIEYHTTFPLTGTVKKEETFLKTSSSTSKPLSSKTIFSAARSYTSPINNKRYFKVYTVNEDENLHYLNNGSSVYQRNFTTYSEPSLCGNIGNTQVTNYDIAQSENYSKQTVAIYNNSGNNCFEESRLKSARVYSRKNGLNTRSRYSEFTYTPYGQIETEIIEPLNSSKKLTTRYTYDDYGNVLTKKISGNDIQDRIVTTGYDFRGRFATSTTNALGHKETRIYDEKLGVLTQVIDANLLSTKMYYNDFAQQYLTVTPNNTYSHVRYYWNAILINGAYSRYYTETKGSDNSTLRQYYDQLDRVIRTLKSGLDGQISVVDKVYDSYNADLLMESLPYLQGSTPKWITYTYDDLGRVETVTRPGENATTMTYTGLLTTTTDPKNNYKLETNNVLGKPLKVVDDLGNRIDYEYYSTGQLKSTTSTAGYAQQDTPDQRIIITSFEYDVVGNKTKMIDADMGTWNYTYYSTGELKTQLDAKGQLQTLYYDELGRLKTRSEPAGNTNWFYDDAIGKGKGKLARVFSPGTTKIISYDSLGKPALEELRIAKAVNNPNSKNYFFTQKIYDAHGRLETVKYPNINAVAAAAVEVDYEYSYGGKLKRIKNGLSNAEYWRANTSDAFGNLTEQRFGNGVNRTETFDSLGRIDKILSSRSTGTTLQFLDYDFDQVGNLIKRQNNLTQASETFFYDDINRLKRTNTTFQNATSSKYNYYDGHGNITRKDNKTYRYLEGSSKHAVSNISGEAYTYDTNGNMTAGAGRTISWNSFNKPSNISRGTKSIKLLYDADRNRVYKESINSVANGINKKTWYVSGVYEREQITSGNNLGAETHKYYLKAGNQTIGYITQSISNTGNRSPNNIRYLLNDHLGSVDVITKADGNIAQRLSFDSWGNRRQGNWNAVGSQLDSIISNLNAESMRMGYTGHEHDDEIGLVNMKGRLYDAEIGRFISADPHIQFAKDTQSYNRYTYVRNNPLSITDPTGYFWGIGTWFKKQFKKWGRSLIAIAATIFTGGLASVYVGIKLGYGAVAGAIAGGAVGGFVGGGIATGTWSGAFRGAAFGALSAGLTSGISNLPNGTYGIGRGIVHGVAQGTVSVLRGGKFGAGFLSGFTSHVSATNGLINGSGKYAKYIRTSKAAILGGTVSRLVGGKFANGAVTAAFVHLFNAEVTKANQRKIQKDWFDTATNQRHKLLGLTPKDFASAHNLDLTNPAYEAYRRNILDSLRNISVGNIGAGISGSASEFAFDTLNVASNFIPVSRLAKFGSLMVVPPDVFNSPVTGFLSYNYSNYEYEAKWTKNE